MSNPRIISGGAKGMILKPVPGDSTRPVTDRVKTEVVSLPVHPSLSDADIETIAAVANQFQPSK